METENFKHLYNVLNNEIKRIEPMYDRQADYQTNSKSYYDYLAKLKKLFELLSNRIWEYDDELKKRFEEWDKLIEKFPENVEKLLNEWLESGVLGTDIINFLVKYRDQYFINVNYYGIKPDNNDYSDKLTEILNKYDYLYFPKGEYYLSNIKIKSGKKHIIGQFEKTVFKSSYSAPILNINNDSYVYDLIFEKIVFEGSYKENIVNINNCSNILFDTCIFRNDTNRFSNGVFIDNSSYYVYFNKCKFSKLNIPIIIKGKSNSGQVVESTISKCVYGINLISANGWLFQKNTFQDYDYEGIHLMINEDNYNQQNSIMNNYFESLRNVNFEQYGVVIDEGVTSYFSFGNKYSDLPTKKGKSTYAIDLDFSGGTFNEPLRITPFVTIDTKPFNYTVYNSDKTHGSMNVFSTKENDGKPDELLVNLLEYTTDGAKKYIWNKVITGNRETNIIDLNKMSLSNVDRILLGYNSALILPTGDYKKERNIVYDDYFKALKFFNGTDFKFIQNINYGVNLPETFYNGGQFFNTVDKKTYTYYQGEWYDFNGNALNEEGV